MKFQDLISKLENYHVAEYAPDPKEERELIAVFNKEVPFCKNVCFV